MSPISKCILVLSIFFCLSLSAADEDYAYVIFKINYHSEYSSYKGVSAPFKVKLKDYSFLQDEKWSFRSKSLQAQLKKRNRAGYFSGVEIIIITDKTEAREEFNQLIDDKFHKFTVVTLTFRKTQKAYMADPNKKEIAAADKEDNPAVPKEELAAKKEMTEPERKAYWDIYD